MEFSTQSTVSLHQIKTAALAVAVFTDGQLSDAADVIDRASQGAVSEVLKTEFKAKLGTHLVLRNLPGVAANRVILIGLGKHDGYNLTAHASGEHAFASYCVLAGLSEGVSTLASIDLAGSTFSSRARNAAIAVGRANYRYNETLSSAKEEKAIALKKIAVWAPRAKAAAAQKGLREGAAIAEGMALTRLLGDLPPNLCTPTYLGVTAKKLAKEFKTIKAQVLDRKQIETLKMGSFLSVARGSDEPPAFIVLKHTPSIRNNGTQQAPIVLVGKGITFDSGGISIKPSSNMDEMKYDMCGAASVFGALRAVAQLDIGREVIGLIPACENLPSGRANKPGDVLTSMSGQTIEVLNTDAEGRLVLCDALTYAERFKPAAVIDIATLTGACVVALGHVNSGLFSTDDALAESLLKAGRDTSDTAWRMPLDDAYQEQLRSNFADIANIGGPPAGAVTAACFLSRFTKKYPWAHLDIAGTAWRSGKDKGASGRPVPLLVQYLIDQSV